MIFVSPYVLFPPNSMAAEAVPQNLLEKFKFPKELRKPEMLYFLERMDWMLDVAKSGKWMPVTAHPVL